MIKTIVLSAKNISLPLGGTAVTYVADAGIQRKIQGTTLLEEIGTDAANLNATKKVLYLYQRKKWYYWSFKWIEKPEILLKEATESVINKGNKKKIFQ